jgi:phosphoglycolate phosphatase
MNYQAVLFDLDGTLLDTLDDIAEATNRALRGLGFPEHRAESYKLMVGDGVENLVRRVLPEGHRDAATVAACAERMRGEYARHWAVKTHPYEGIVELLDALAVRGIAMAVLSNKPEDFTRLCVEKLLPAGRFAAILGARPSLPKKPDPAGALQIAGQLGLAPAAFIYLGDTNTDMRTAVAAGMSPIGALWGFRAAEELSAAGAKALLARPADLLGLLDGGIPGRI